MFPILEVIISSLIRGSLYVLISASLALVFGIISVSSFIQGDMLMLGAYVTFFAITLLGLDPIFAIPLTALVMFSTGCLIEKGLLHPLRKVSGKLWMFNTFVLTLGISQIIQNGVLIALGPMFRGVKSFWEGAVNIFGTTLPIDRIVLLISSVSIIILLWAFLKYTKLGRAIRAVGINEEAVTLFGIDINKIYTFTFGISGLLTGIAGAFYMVMFTAYPVVGVTPNLKAWIVVLIAGLGNVKGAVYCSFLLAFIETVAYYVLSAGWQNALIILVVVLVLLFKPAGLFGTEVKGIWEK